MCVHKPGYPFTVSFIIIVLYVTKIKFDKTFCHCVHEVATHLWFKLLTF